MVKNGFRHVGSTFRRHRLAPRWPPLAADALGPEQVTQVAMLALFQRRTRADAREMANRSGRDWIEFSIGDASGFLFMTAPANPRPGSLPRTQQARIRGNLMMAIPLNSWGWLILTTANKSETRSDTLDPTGHGRRVGTGIKDAEDPGP